MDIADETGHAALAYVVAVRRRGYRLTLKEFEAYASSPRRRAIPPKSLSSFITTFEVFQANPEPVSAWLVRLGWISADDDGSVMLTPLGEAVLRELDDREISSETPLEVTLSPEDPIAYARAIERIASHGDAMLVDPFFRLDDLLPVTMNTGISRLLTSDRSGKEGKARIGTLGVALDRLQLERPFEIRVSDEIHDRFVIPSAGPVDSIGTSVGGIGRRFSVMVRIASPIADDIREGHERMWEAARNLLGRETKSEKKEAITRKTPTSRRRRVKRTGTMPST